MFCLPSPRYGDEVDGFILRLIDWSYLQLRLRHSQTTKDYQRNPKQLLMVSQVAKNGIRVDQSMLTNIAVDKGNSYYSSDIVAAPE